MFQIRYLFSIAIIAFSLAICFTSQAQAQKIPAGSYQKTCTNIKVDNNLTLSAKCQVKDPNKFMDVPPPLKNYFLCVGDISNNDGTLTCQKNENSPQLKAAKKAIDEGMLNALGYKTGSNSEYFLYIGKMFAAGMDASFYKGWNSVETAQFFKNYLAKPENAAVRAALIENAIKAVTGMPPAAERQAFYDAEIRNSKIGYSEIVMLETSRQNSNEISRKLIILRAYKDAFGRAPTSAEQSYWVQRKENYSQLIEANRNWLYSTQGSKDLAETIKRALTEKYAKTSVNDSDISKAMIQYSKGKKIYDEM